VSRDRGLALEPRPQLRRQRLLDRDLAAQSAIARANDATHPAAAQNAAPQSRGLTAAAETRTNAPSIAAPRRAPNAALHVLGITMKS
jgi:hypothetical protein